MWSTAGQLWVCKTKFHYTMPTTHFAGYRRPAAGEQLWLQIVEKTMLNRELLHPQLGQGFETSYLSLVIFIHLFLSFFGLCFISISVTVHLPPTHIHKDSQTSLLNTQSHTTSSPFICSLRKHLGTTVFQFQMTKTVLSDKGYGDED